MRAAVAAIAALAASSASAQLTRSVTSAAPDKTAVTVYRNPARQRTQAMNLAALNGFALVTETRRLRVPRGRTTIRFEGVAGGIIPVSAVIDGLPGGTVEKNRDARLLSPAALVDGTLGNRVTLRRTDPASGVVREEDATIISGPTDGVVVRTATGVEALSCSGLGESPRYPGVPAGLSARPVLSVTTDNPRATTVTVTLSYLATGFDWAASYIATLAPDGRSLDLFAWLTLANGNAEGLSRAQVQGVAGRLNRRSVREIAAAAQRLSLTCYPLGTTTSDLRERRFTLADEIVVTGARTGTPEAFAPVAIAAPPAPPAPPPPPAEDLGDLKLYRVPEPVDVNANAQKQVALLQQGAVPFDRIYRLPLWPGQMVTNAPVPIFLRLRNTKDRNLGIPLPSGSIATYTTRGSDRFLIGTGGIDDAAEGETVRIPAGISEQVRIDQRQRASGRAVVTVSNASALAVAVELPIGPPGARTIAADADALIRIDGVQTWRVTVPANGTATLAYRY